MFTLEQIKTAHAKVKSGADFPRYIHDLKELGVVHYETFVVDGHTDYYGQHGYKTASPARYEKLAIAGTGNAAQLERDLKIHQQGGTDYMTFCTQASQAGVATWVVDIGEMTCTYYDQSRKALLAEAIPSCKPVS